ncbi:peptide deformylase [Lusitaniella coriacea LEGE 07157]|uniref:Peptide deformylase n=1 Tax=Lusitaniella coriacea LEGE 07157 TaxID=945747 RepID=A0A8J7JCY5_9CYAN|nr:peptide deformylase [Lusitaniella coriacea]MBE9117970.1 peptide deformylase [Lusitaniella coriacea LEGE 07157]
MDAPLEIAQLGNDILRRKAQSVERIDDPKIQSAIDNLIATARLKNGVGIAAPQVSRSYRLFIVASRPNERYPDAPEMEPTAMLNPGILSHGEERVKGWEGCLSVPGFRGLVPRYERIEVEYWDRQGRHNVRELSGFIARIFQHELDHLNGILFIDRAESPQDLVSEEDYWNLHH